MSSVTQLARMTAVMTLQDLASVFPQGCTTCHANGLYRSEVPNHEGIPPPPPIPGTPMAKSWAKPNQVPDELEGCRLHQLGAASAAGRLLGPGMSGGLGKFACHFELQVLWDASSCLKAISKLPSVSSTSEAPGAPSCFCLFAFFLYVFLSFLLWGHVGQKPRTIRAPQRCGVTVWCEVEAVSFSPS